MPCSSSRSVGIYDRQVAIALFKRLHATNYTLAPKSTSSIIGPGSYTPRTIEEIYRDKACSRYGPYYQQSERFSLNHRQTKHRCNPHVCWSCSRSVSLIPSRSRSSSTGSARVRLFHEWGTIPNEVKTPFDSTGKATITADNDERWEHALLPLPSTRREISSMNCDASKRASVSTDGISERRTDRDTATS